MYDADRDGAQVMFLLLLTAAACAWAATPAFPGAEGFGAQTPGGRAAEPFLTIAGQTAPGDGICIRGSEVSIATHDVIVRYLRFRPGDISGQEVDAVNIVGDSRDVIVDHVSAGWSVDETLSPSGGVRNVTVQWSVIAEG